MTKFIFISLLLILSVVVNSQISQPIPHPTIWLKSENVCDSLQKWTDCSGNGNDLMLPAPGMLSDEKINFQQCLRIDTIESALKIDYIIKSSAEVTVFAVYKADASIDDYGIWAVRLDSTKKISLSTQNIVDLKSEVIEYADSTESIALINLFRSKWINKEIDTLVSGINVLGNDSVPFKGSFAEFIFYDDGLSYDELEKVYTYLAIKYGISIYRMNYVDSTHKIIWDFEDNSQFSNNVAGIGCDTILNINKKQSCASGGEDELILFTGELEDLNDDNNSIIPHGDFLIWSDNGRTMNFITPDTLNPDFNSAVSDRKWLMISSGATSMEINTNLKIRVPNVNDSTFLILLINKEADFNFPIDYTDLVYPDSVDAEGYYYYSEINWDIDNSGSDAFAFQNFRFNDLIQANNNPGNTPDGLNEFLTNFELSNYELSGSNTMEQSNYINNPKVLSSVSIYPNPTKGEFVVKADLSETSDLVFKIFDASAKLIESKSFGNRKDYTINSYLKIDGCYFIVVETKEESKTIKLIVQ